MFERLRKALVESFVGAIGLGYLLAQGILHFAATFTAPVTGWVMRREYRGLMESAGLTSGFSFKDALPEFVMSFLILMVGYFLLRWLYFKPVRQESEPASGQHA